jgi:excisionase family DNA binding protein
MGERSLKNGPDKYISAVEAAKYLGLSITEFLDAVDSGKIPRPYMLGLHRRWKLIELEEKTPQ